MSPDVGRNGTRGWGMEVGEWGQNEKVGSDTERRLARYVKWEWKFKGSGANGLEGINLSLALLTLGLLGHVLCEVVICCLRVFVLHSVWRLFGYSSVVEQTVAHQKMPLKCLSQDFPVRVEIGIGSLADFIHSFLLFSVTAYAWS